MASKFFGKIASAFSRWGKKNGAQKSSGHEHESIMKAPPSAIMKSRSTKTDSVEATTGQSTERPMGSMSPSGDSHAYSPGAWRGKPMSYGNEAMMNSGNKGTGKNGRAQTGRDTPKRSAYEGEQSPKGLWSEPRHERLSDPFGDRPSREPASRPSAHSIH
jgi:hypothetical protein